MKRSWIMICLLFLLGSQASFAAIRYDFEQVTKSDSSHTPTARVVGRGTIDGEWIRIDYLKGSTGGAGTYIISPPNSTRYTVVNPVRRTYAERDAENLMAQTVQSLGLRVENVRTDRQQLGAGPVIAGHPTQHHRLTTSYDLTVTIGEIQIKKHVRTVLERWTTTDFPETASLMGRNSELRTGDPSLDRLIEIETAQITGFPLRQIVDVTTMVDRRSLPRNSVLDVKPARSQRSEILVRRIERIPSSRAWFEIPEGFQRDDLQKPPDGERGIHVLSMDAMSN